MEETISEIAFGFVKNICGILTGGKGLPQIESVIFEQVKMCAAQITKSYIEKLDAEILQNKAGRRAAGLTVQRRSDERRLQAEFGELTYLRTYYKKISGGYEYPADVAFGVASHERVSEGVGRKLVAAAKEMSYGRASSYVSGGAVSRQTVMHRVRTSAAVCGTPARRRVPELHIDADEAHVTLLRGKKSEVPLISVYEGIERQGKRGVCKNIFHISEYGKSPDDLWEQALTEIERRYDLSDTKIYLHGDGGQWIHKGLEWLPNAVFVLDKYHKNKAIINMTAGFANKKDREIYGRELRWALENNDMRFFRDLTDSICEQTPARKKIICESAVYLQHFAEGISICKTDPGANRGGCTEPHISHVLAARLSTRPMAWSKQTLKAFAPILAADKFTIRKKEEPKALPPALAHTASTVRQQFRESAACLPMPGAIGTLPWGKVTEDTRQLHGWM